MLTIRPIFKFVSISFKFFTFCFCVYYLLVPQKCQLLEGRKSLLFNDVYLASTTIAGTQQVFPYNFTNFTSQFINKAHWQFLVELKYKNGKRQRSTLLVTFIKFNFIVVLIVPQKLPQTYHEWVKKTTPIALIHSLLLTSLFQLPLGHTHHSLPPILSSHRFTTSLSEILKVPFGFQQWWKDPLRSPSFN